MHFSALSLAALAALLGSTTAAALAISNRGISGPSIEMNFYNHNACARFSVPEPVYVSGNQTCAVLPYPGLAAYYYDEKCRLLMFQDKNCEKGYGFPMPKQEGHCFDLSTFGSYEAVCS